jgi:hypothetical protein
MFDPAAPVALLNLLLAYLLRPFQPRSWRALERMEQVLADALRATLVDAGIAVPDLSNAKLIAWFNAHHPYSDQIPLFRTREGAGGEGGGGGEGSRNGGEGARFAHRFWLFAHAPSPPATSPTRRGRRWRMDRRLPADIVCDTHAVRKPAPQSRAPP